jgi:predicted membrane protein
MIFLAVALFVAIAVIAYQQYAFTSLLAKDREQQRVERERMLQRIQDPPTAVAQHAQREQEDQSIPKHYVEFDDDEDFNNYRTQMEG